MQVNFFTALSTPVLMYILIIGYKHLPDIHYEIPYVIFQEILGVH